MADGIQYDVSAVLKVAQAGAFVSDMGRAAEAADDLQKSLDKALGGATKMGAGLLQLGGQAVDMAAKIGAVGAAVVTGAVGAATVAVGKNLSLLEGKSIQLSSVIAAATEKPFAEARIESEKLFAQFKTDAIQSAGETQNFVETAALIAGPILGANQGMEKLHQLTKGVIDIAPALGIEFKQVGSDVSKILQGSAGADIPLFQAMRAIPALAIPAAEAFNKLEPEKRIDAITKALTNPAFQAGASMAGDSFAGLMSTSQDLLKTMGGMALSPAFGVFKGALKGITTDLIAGLGEGGPVRLAFERLGSTIAHRFSLLGMQLGRIFPSLNASVWDTTDAITALVDRGLARVVSGVEWVADRWPQITAGAHAFALTLDRAADRTVEMVRMLGGGDFMKGLERAGLLLVGGKVAGPALTTVAGAAQLGQGLFGAGRWAAGALGGGAASGAAASAATAAAAEAGAAAGAAAGASAGASAAASGTAGMGLFSATAATGGLAAGVAGFAAASYLAIEQDTFGFFRFLRNQWDTLSTSAEGLVRNVKGLWGQLTELGGAVMQLYEAMKPLLGAFASLYAVPLALAFDGIVFAAQTTVSILNTLATTLQYLAQQATPATEKLAEFIDAVADRLGLKRPKLAGVEEEMVRRELDLGLGAMPVITSSGALAGVGVRSPSKPPDKGKEVTVVIKWDLGEGNEDAIYLRSRRDITEALKNAKTFVRGAPLPRGF